jgi:hypothetical protein
MRENLFYSVHTGSAGRFQIEVHHELSMTLMYYSYVSDMVSKKIFLKKMK